MDLQAGQFAMFPNEHGIWEIESVDYELRQVAMKSADNPKEKLILSLLMFEQVGGKVCRTEITDITKTVYAGRMIDLGNVRPYAVTDKGEKIWANSLIVYRATSGQITLRSEQLSFDRELTFVAIGAEYAPGVNRETKVHPQLVGVGETLTIEVPFIYNIQPPREVEIGQPVKGENATIIKSYKVGIYCPVHDLQGAIMVNHVYVCSLCEQANQNVKNLCGLNDCPNHWTGGLSGVCPDCGKP